jgi:hypothetical protein
VAENGDNGAVTYPCAGGIANRSLLLELQYLPNLGKLVCIKMVSLRF